MSQEKHSRHAVLSETTTFDRNSGDLRIVIETPKGSRNKYKYEPECDCLELTNVLPEGMIFPYDFGFIPSTIGPDGDPLDVLVFMDAPVVPGCVIRSRSGEGNEEGAAIWRQITAAVEELQRKRRPAEAVNELNLSSCDKCHPLTQRCGAASLTETE
jgi:Inorganic pyrophosphatase